ncbi:alpha-L-rhamnosidase-related protein [Lactobacillus amylovorus]|uniref:alpha-L-rhamnosidase-related protein n=1 Tax=Lactobacillus amylovorus TaxID=1604 RepID=UPI003F8A1D93
MDAKWIWSKKDKKINKPTLVYFQKNVKINKNKSCSIKISADSRYELYINGELKQVGPQKGSINHWFYDEIDLSQYLHDGVNDIGVKVLHYPDLHNQGNFGIARTNTPGLYIAGEQICTDSTWLYYEPDYQITSEDPDFAPLQIYEDVKGDKETANLINGEVDNQWQYAKEYEEAELAPVLKDLNKRTIPFLYRDFKHFDGIKEIRQSAFKEDDWNNFLQKDQELTIPANTTEIVEISAGKEMTGYLSLKMRNGADTKIKILQSEAYVTNEMTSVNGLPIPVKSDRTDSKNGHLKGFTDSYCVLGMQDEEYSPFWFRTFRYIQLKITTSNEPLTLKSFTYEETGYPLQIKSHVETSDPSLSAIWNLSKLTLRRCMHETYEDCPFYEQLQYVMDSRAQMLYTYAISYDDRLARNAISSFRRSQRPDGTLNAAYPSFEKNVIPGFSIYFIMMLYDHMMYFGDKKLLLENLTTMERILDYFENHRQNNGLIGVLGGLNGQADYWSFIDWTKEWNATTGVPTAYKYGPLTMESLLYLMGLQAAIKVADFLGEDELKEEYQVRADQLARAIRKYCVGKDGMIQDGPGVEEYSQHCQVFGILTNVLSKTEVKINLLKTIRESDKYAQCSVAMSYYLFEALREVDIYQYTDKYWNIWRNMIAKHCTTSVEAESGERSECHAWGAIALYELPAITLGIRPAEPGFKKVKLDIVPGYLDWAKGEVITPKGLVKVSWKKENSDIKVKYRIPKDLKIQFGNDDMPKMQKVMRA